ncbi:Probable prolyl 4-hydroxylase [Seminavis robusta]|uniref:Probable prolyl 4-hydroxylase n=1 Tax=Seminavis robusta TaxID=568900 RepID=A0A9N8DQQ0_9STRA|nr:Probable prolyl 4-hydroxylase [Seminavis robusta]|eukprot:Sro215_g089020.1 Probable prolyl 4-hydroxylase (378) ;mRNA; r:40203-41336
MAAFFFRARLLPLMVALCFLAAHGFSPTTCNRSPPRRVTALSSATTTDSTSVGVGPRLAIREDFPGCQRIHSDPDIFVISGFLDPASCQDLIRRANDKGLQQSPVAYAGWTQDFKDLVELAAKGPVTWLAIGVGWWQTKDDPTAGQVELIGHMVQNFVLFMGLAIAGIGLFTKSRADQLQDLRTSTSTTLDDLNSTSKQETQGPLQFVRRTAELFTPGSSSSDSLKRQQQQDEAALFEAPTVIRYESRQVLAPHYDANRSAATEDANRGGQTLATLLVYLNDVAEGGLTRFGKLDTASPNTQLDYAQVDESQEKLCIRPKMGDALLFFPADVSGKFDERTEHEGCPAVDEKYIARIWRHQNRVPPPFGLAQDELLRV